MSGSSEDLFRLQIRSILKNFEQFWILEFGSLISRNSCFPFFSLPFYSIIALVLVQRSYFHSTSHVNCSRIIIRMLDLDLGYINLGKFFFFILLIWKTRELDQVSLIIHSTLKFLNSQQRKRTRQCCPHITSPRYVCRPLGKCYKTTQLPIWILK